MRLLDFLTRVKLPFCVFFFALRVDLFSIVLLMLKIISLVGDVTIGPHDLTGTPSDTEQRVRVGEAQIPLLHFFSITFSKIEKLFSCRQIEPARLSLSQRSFQEVKGMCQILPAVAKYFETVGGVC